MAGAIRRNHRIGMANPAVSSRSALTMALMVALLHPTDALTVSFGLSATSTSARSRPLIAYDGGGSESVKVVRDALMNRAVEQQLSSFAVMHDTARKSYLYTQWTQFIQKAQAHATGPGSLTLFISHLQRSKTTSVFVPKRMFRQLSPGNPYAPKNVDGHHEEVRPTQIALSLISCREQLAEYWVENHQIFTNAFKGEDGASTTNVRLKGFNCALEQCCVVCRKPPRGYDLRRRCLAMDAARHAPQSPHAL